MKKNGVDLCGSHSDLGRNEFVILHEANRLIYIDSFSLR
jgi:hypothetical protein